MKTFSTRDKFQIIAFFIERSFDNKKIVKVKFRFTILVKFPDFINSFHKNNSHM
jgi:hypothetical protein